MNFPNYTPVYAREEFSRLIEIYDGSRYEELELLNDWCLDHRMKQIYESLEKSGREDKGYFILAMLDSATLDLDKFKREDELVRKMDKKITNMIYHVCYLINDRMSINEDAPDYYRELLDCASKKKPSDRQMPSMPKMIRLANATRQTKASKYGINKVQHARALIVNLSDNGFDVSNIKEAISTALNIIYDYPSQIFSEEDIRNAIRSLPR